jgi:hypothetical protein
MPQIVDSLSYLFFSRNEVFELGLPSGFDVVKVNDLWSRFIVLFLSYRIIIKVKLVFTVSRHSLQACTLITQQVVEASISILYLI